MTNTPEGLPSRIELPGGCYWRPYEVGSKENGFIALPDSWHIAGDVSLEGARKLAAAMNAPTPLESTLGSALEDTLRLLDIWAIELAKDPYGKESYASLVRQMTEARAALEAWKVGRHG